MYTVQFFHPVNAINKRKQSHTHKHHTPPNIFPTHIFRVWLNCKTNSNNMNVHSLTHPALRDPEYGTKQKHSMA